MRRRVLLVMLGLLTLVGLGQFFLSDNVPVKDDNTHRAGSDTSNKAKDVVVPETELLAGTDLTCEAGVPCQYSDVLDLRIIVMVYNRAASLQKVLDSLQNLELDGDKAVVDIWIDRSKEQKADVETVLTAKRFQWKHGGSTVHVQKKHVGIYGQWIDTWRPRPNTTEIALFLEDDVDVSPYAYRWLKATYRKYSPMRAIAGYALFEGAIYNLAPKHLPDDSVAFLHQRMGSQGMSPDANFWRDFQDWYHTAIKDPKFHPYVSADPDVTGWYRSFEKSKKADSMWSIWYIYYNDKHKLLTLYSNIGKVTHKKDPKFLEAQYLAFHRKEQGMHFKGKPSSSSSKLITTWQSDFLNLPPFQDLKRFSYSGKLIKWVWLKQCVRICCDICDVLVASVKVNFSGCMEYIGSVIQCKGFFFFVCI